MQEIYRDIEKIDMDNSDFGFAENERYSVIRDHRDLIVWQNSMRLAECIYSTTNNFPRREIYGLTSQLRRAAISISSNIAEGYGRGTSGAYVQFLRIAQGSAREVQSLLEMSKRLGFLNEIDHSKLDSDSTDVLKMLGSLIRKIEN